MGKIIFHIDVNSAFLSWEAVYRKEVQGSKEVDLRQIPSAVGGDKEKRHGIILAKSIPAKKYNIQTGESIPEALAKCPDLVLVKPHYNLYERCSDAFYEILTEYAPVIEVYSVDEMWCDMTAVVSMYESPVVLAEVIKARIYHELGFTVNIGISTNKILAKMASDFQKPDRVHTLFAEEIPAKLWPLPVREMFFVGRATEKKLKNLGIFTIGELANADLRLLKTHLKKHGEVIWCYANGFSAEEVSDIVPDNKGYGNSTTVAFDVSTTEDARKVLLGLSEMVCTRLRKDRMYAQVISVETTDYLFQHKSHQRKILTATNTTNEFYKHVQELFDESWDHTPLRKLGARAGQVTRDPLVQFNLFDGDRYEKFSKMDAAVDQIRLRYGRDAVMRANFLGGQIHHMIGGVAPEKAGETQYAGSEKECRKIFQ